jgi:hypothetical protein
MGSQNAASNRSVASGMEQSKKDTKTIGLIQASEKYARDKLGITKTVAGPIKGANTSVTGIYSSKVSNQMYGDKYREAQGEFLASKGLATAREITDATGKKFTVYDKSKELMDAVNKTSIPLSKQMYQSQQNFKLGIAAVAALAGIPVMPGILFQQSQVPYQSYINKKEGGVFSYSTAGSNQTKKDSNQRSDQTTEMGNQDPNAFRAENEAARKKYLASLKSAELAKGDRKFIQTSSKGFGNTFLV